LRCCVALQKERREKNRSKIISYNAIKNHQQQPQQQPQPQPQPQPQQQQQQQQ
jgi:hypothetical protein